MKKDWILNQDAFEKLLSRLDADRHNAAEIYERIRAKLVKFFKWRGCSNPEEYADRTIDQVCRRIAEGVELHVSDPYLYFHGTAINVLKRTWREPEIEPLEMLPPSKSPVVDPIETSRRDSETASKEQRLQCLDECLKTLPMGSLELISAYHSPEGGQNKVHRKILADTLGIPMNALRIRAWRVRTSLEKCVNGCLSRAERK